MKKTTRFYIGIIIFSITNFIFYTIIISLFELISFRNIRIEITMLGGIISMIIKLLYKRNELDEILNDCKEIDKNE